MWGLTEVTWFLATVMGIWGLVGFVPHLWRPERRAAWWFAFVVVLLLLKADLRSLYWDGLGILIGPETAREWHAALGWTDVNWVFNVIAMAAAYGGLRLLYLLIPEDERDHYTTWTAPIYPARLSMAPLIAYLRETWDRDRRD